jgi:hypothetical protein
MSAATPSAPTGAPRRAPGRASLLALAVLLPAAVLFGQAWQGQSDRISFAERERHGIEYLTTLGQVATALTDAQSAAVAGRAVDGTALARAMDATSTVDDRLGDELRTRERWSGLRVKIEALPAAASGDPAARYAAYAEATDLLLALYGKVRENSQLIRDPDGDTYFLQDGAAEELPEAVVAAGQFTDLVVIAAGLPANQRAAAAGEVTAARQGVLDPAGDLADDLQSAVDSTQSRTMGGNLLSRLDRFQRAMDTLAASGDTTQTVDANRLAGTRTEVQAAASDLSTAILAELDVLIEQRIDGLWTQRWLSLGALLLAVLLAVATPALVLRRRRQQFDRPVREIRESYEVAGAAR